MLISLTEGRSTSFLILEKETFVMSIHFEMGVDHENVHQGKVSGYVKSKTVQDAGDFSTMMQQFKTGRYI